MAFDAVAVRCLVKDLKDKLINSRIDKIHQPEKDEITINLRTMTDNFKLVLSASPAHPRVHFTNVSKKNPISAPMFCMLLRKHIGSGKITDIEQIGFERIIKFSIESYDELGDLTTKYLIVEIMGRHSNIILTNQDMRILDCIKHIDFTVSSVRQLLPGQVSQLIAYLCRKRQEHILSRVAVYLFNIIVCQKACLGQVWRDDIGLPGKRLHAIQKSGRVYAVGSAVIAHHRVHEQHRVFLIKYIQKIHKKLNLL